MDITNVILKGAALIGRYGCVKDMDIHICVCVYGCVFTDTLMARLHIIYTQLPKDRCPLSFQAVYGTGCGF